MGDVEIMGDFEVTSDFEIIGIFELPKGLKQGGVQSGKFIWVTQQFKISYIVSARYQILNKIELIYQIWTPPPLSYTLWYAGVRRVFFKFWLYIKN